MANLRAELKAELERAGLFEYHPGRVYLKVLVLVAATVGLFVAMFLVQSWWLKAPLFAAGLFSNIALVMVGHDSGHGAVSRTKWVNDLLGYLTFPLMAGMSIAYWKWKHNTLHHSFPNVAEKDPDVKIYPFAMNKEQQAKGGFQRFVQRYQGLAFWPLTTFTAFAMRWDGIDWHLKRGKKLAPALDRRIDLACMGAHYVLWLVVPPVFFHVPFLTVLGFYVAWSAVAGLLLAAIFLPAHMELPLYRGYDENFILQLRTTQNLLTNPLFSFLLIGLDHQVEHHLFQRMSHLSAKKAAPIVRAFCARKGLPYYEKGWAAALWATTKRIDRLPEYELLERPPKDDIEAMKADPVFHGPAEFTKGGEAAEPTAVPTPAVA